MLCTVIIACGGDLTNNQSSSDQRQTSEQKQSSDQKQPSDQRQPSEQKQSSDKRQSNSGRNQKQDGGPYQWGGSALDKLISIDFNAPSKEFKQQLITHTGFPEEHRQFFNEVHASINQVVGSYPNYFYIVYDKERSNEENEPIIQKLKDLNFKGGRLRTVADVHEERNCLTGSNTGQSRTASTNPISICLEDLKELTWYGHQYGDSSLEELQNEPWKNLTRLALHYAHEYFHHYQRAHSLDRGLDYQGDRDNPRTTVYAPPWWTEGAAVAFQNAWLRQHWQDISFFDGQTWEDGLGNISIASVTTPWAYKEIRRAIMGGPSEGRGRDCTPDFTMGPWTERYDTERAPDADKCPAFMMAAPYLATLTSWQTVWIDIPRDFYDLELGFWGAIEKYTGMDTQTFYDNFNAFLRAGDPEDEPPAGWQPQPGPFADYADFFSIVSRSN